MDLVTRLRYNIRTFSLQYFSGPIGHIKWQPEVIRDKRSYYSRFITSTPNFYFYFTTPARRPGIIQAVLWKAIVDDLFGQFRWAGDMSYSLWELCEHFYPSKYN
jgi:hypothetical protein